ncbi:MAG: YCF48-related protein [Xanthomonadales bacterium]|nr:YCF48-related protein [Xanthomonadales bacterium]
MRGETGLDIEYAQIMPLATESLLLDVTRSPQGFVAVGERGHVLLSADGRNWTQADVVPTRSTLTVVEAREGRLWAAGHDAVIITSGDGGKTWSLEYFDPERQQAVMDLYFTDKYHGIAIGSYGLRLETDDGGKTWVDAPVDEENEYHLNSLVDFGDGRRMIAGEAGYSYRSFDDGETWELMDLPYSGSMWDALLTSNGCVIFSGLRGHALETCDFGDSWKEFETGTQSSLSDAAESAGVLVFAGNGGTVVKRDDGIIQSYNHSSGVDFAAVLPLGDGQFLLVGEGGVHLFPEPSAEERP